MMRKISLLWLAVLVTRCASSWSTEAIARNNHEKDLDLPSHLLRSVNVSVNLHEICVFDRLKIEWEASALTNLDTIGIAFVSIGGKIGNVISLQSTVQDNDQDAMLETTDGLIRCDVNEEHCVPKVKSISAQPDQNRIVVLFEVATNQPKLVDVFALQEAIIVHPEIMFHGAFAEWKAPDRLEIQVDSIDMKNLLSAHSKGELIEAVPRISKTTAKKGSTVLRPAEPGSYEVIVVDRAQRMEQLHRSEANSQIVRVEACDDAVIITNRHAESVDIRAGGKNQVRAAGDGSVPGSLMSTAPHRIVHMQGAAAVTGLEPIAFADATVDPKGAGSWSFSAWIRIVEPPTRKFRAVLHKGSSDGQTRTPSMWLMPDDNRLSVRVSTEKNPDLGAETINAIPTNQWTFLSVVFTNHTKAAAASPSSAVSAVENTVVEGLSISYPSSDVEDAKATHIATPTTAVSSAPDGAQSEPTGTQYTVEVYINGALDVKMEFSHVVLGNNHTANFFKDVSFAGPKALLSEFTLWDDALTAAEVEAMYLSNAGRAHRSAANTALDVLASAQSPLVFSASSVIPPTDSASITAGTSEDLQEAQPAFADPGKIPEDPMVPILLQRAKASLEACESLETRLDIYAEAAERGSAEALYKWAMLIKQGSEVSNTACGVTSGAEGDSSQSASSLFGSSAPSLWGSKASSVASGYEHERAVQALLVAADMGHHAALVPLAFALLNGLGAEPLLSVNSTISTSWNIPVHPEYIVPGDRSYYRPVRLQHALNSNLVSGDEACGAMSGSAPDSHTALAGSVLHVKPSNVTDWSDKRASKSNCPDPTALAVGLLHVAAVHGVAEAHQALAYRYREGFGVLADVETAAVYHRLPGRVTAEEFHLIGAQSVVETDRIDDNTAPELSKGHQGNDDELIQHQKIRAAEGHLPSILAMADLYYYGARGLPRDHARALRYFEQAAHVGDESGLCGAAGMYLKGEGAETNVTRAVELYENASSTGSIRALNGLGYMYYFGQSVPQNQTKAFHYFLSAAMYETDADSLFNAAHCLEHGIGTEKDVNRAVQFYTIAANKLGNFNSINVLANMYYEGRGVPRSAKTALMYHKTATSIGAWAGWLRRGFDQYLRGQYSRSVGAYLHAGELGYEVSQSNAAYILRTKLQAPTGSYADALALPGQVPADVQTCDASQDSADNCGSADTAHTSHARLTAASYGNAREWRERLLARQYQLSAHHGNKESYLHLGTCYFKGTCGVAVNHKRALWYYAKASAQGHALSSAYLGVMYHFGLGTAVNLHRAERYYALAVKKETDKTVVTMVQSLKYALSMKDFYFMMPVNLGLDYVVRTLWK